LSTSKRFIATIVGVPMAIGLAALGPAACGQGYGASPYGTDNGANTAITISPAPSLNNVKGGTLEAPVGSPTDRLIATTIPKMGKVVTDANGWVLYRFDKDTAKPAPATACSGTCATVWPPVLTDGNPIVEGMPASLVGTITRDDGATQLTLAGWPLYRYIGDPKPGAWKGQLVNGTWFVIAPDGKKNLTCVPTATPTAVAPPSASAAANAPAAGGGDYGGGGTGY
jgi:predicted lipoprotein with Yx(FWY)xxD motif